MCPSLSTANENTPCPDPRRAPAYGVHEQTTTARLLTTDAAEVIDAPVAGTPAHGVAAVRLLTQPFPGLGGALEAGGL